MNSTALTSWLRRSTRLLPFLAALVVVLPAIVAVIRLVAGRTWYPTGDMAQAELHVRGIWSHPPLVGAAGRIESDSGVQGSHPGPSMWFALYPVYLLLGRTSAALMTSAVVVHTVAVWVALWMARRFGGLALMVPLAVGYAALVRSSGPAFFTEPWNPWFAVFPFAIFLLAIWASLHRTPRWFILAIAAGSHCVQSHVGYLLIVAGLCAATVALLVVRAARTRSLRLNVAPLAVAAGVLIVMWLPPLLDQHRRTPGNLGILLQHFGSPRDPFLARFTVAKIFASELSSLGPWLTGPTLISRNPIFALVTVGIWAAAIVGAYRQRFLAALWLHAVLGGALALGGLSLLRIFGPYQEYTIRWFWILTVLIVVASVWTLWRVVPHTWRHSLRLPTTALASLAIVGLSAVATVQFADRAQVTGLQDSDMVRELATPVQRVLNPNQVYLMRWHDPVGLGAVPFGLVLELERRGYTVGVDAQFSAAALPHRVVPEARAAALIWVVLGGRIADFRRDESFTEVVKVDLRTEQQRQRSDELAAFLQTRFGEIGQPELFQRLDAQYGAAG